MRHVMTCFTYKECGQRQPCGDEANAEIKRVWAKTVPTRNPAGRKGADGDGDVSCELVESHRETALFGADEINLHDHRR
jgi:hypothetical protein